MKLRIKRRKLAALMGAIAILVVVVWSPIRRVHTVAAIQSSLDRAWEISFHDQTSENPSRIPSYIDDYADSFFAWALSDTIGYDGSQRPIDRNRHIIHHERFRAFFRGPIQELRIYYPERFRGDLGSALARLPNLRRFSIYENEENFPTEDDWTILCNRLRTFPILEEIELGGAWITDSSIASLSGHPTLRSISITYGRLTPECIATFRAIPNLNEIIITEQYFHEDLWNLPENQSAFRDTLPNVAITFP